jgi:CheY-like chemotaxis protein
LEGVEREKGSILVVEDNEATLSLLSALLRREFDLTFARDGEDAIGYLQRFRYDAVLLDLRIPVIDGFGVLEYLAGASPETMGRTIVVTAAVSEGDLDRVRNYPVAAVIRKPFEVADLLQHVRDAAGLASGERPITLFCGSGVLLALAELLREYR